MLSKKCRVNASDVESMALTLSNVSKTLADLKGIIASLILCNAILYNIPLFRPCIYAVYMSCNNNIEHVLVYNIRQKVVTLMT